MKIGFLGFGNIAKAMLEGLTYRNKKLLKEIYASSAHYDKLLKNTKKYGINACKSNEELIDLVQIVLETYKIKETGIQLLKENIKLNEYIQKKRLI